MATVSERALGQIEGSAQALAAAGESLQSVIGATVKGYMEGAEQDIAGIEFHDATRVLWVAYLKQRGET